VIQELSAEDGMALEKCHEREREAWNLYYDILDKVEDALKRGDSFATELREKGKRLVNNLRIITKC
jgi:rubrerythrin